MKAVKHMRVVAIVQARMGSSRLPGKVLMPLLGEPMLARIVRRISTAQCLDAVIVATSTQPEDDAIVAQCKDLDVPCHRGSEENVLERFLDVAQAYDADVIVRLTGDNPMVDGTLVDFVVNGFCEADPEVVYANNVDESGFPFGLYVEVVDAGALREAAADSSPENCEHVTWHIRKHPERYAQAIIKAPGIFPGKAMSIDTAEDYERVSAIFEKNFHKNPDFSFRDLMED